MAKINLNDLSPFLIYDELNFKYKRNDVELNCDYNIQEIINNNVIGEFLELQSISEIVNNAYPFIEERSDQIINELIDRNRRVKKLVYNAIKERKSVELKFDPMSEKEKFIIGLAQSIVSDINTFLYKYEINQQFCNLTLLNNNAFDAFIGNIDFLCSNGKEWFLCSFKISRSSFNQKYAAELFLQKELVESNTNIKISKMFILNPREQRVIIESPPLSKGEIYNLKKKY